MYLSSYNLPKRTYVLWIHRMMYKILGFFKRRSALTLVTHAENKVTRFIISRSAFYGDYCNKCKHICSILFIFSSVFSFFKIRGHLLSSTHVSSTQGVLSLNKSALRAQMSDLPQMMAKLLGYEMILSKIQKRCTTYYSYYYYLSFMVTKHIVYISIIDSNTVDIQLKQL